MASILASLVSSLVPKLAAKGMDLLSSVFKTASKKGEGFIEGAAKKAIDGIASKLEEKTGITIEDIADDKLTEEQWRQLKEFELQEQELLLSNQQELAQIDLELEKALLADVANARSTGTKRDQNEDPLVRRFVYYYAYIMTALTFSFIVFSIFVSAHYGDQFPADAWHVINTVIGFLLGTGLSAIIQYFFGSSMGSKQKAEMLRGIGGPKA